MGHHRVVGVDDLGPARRAGSVPLLNWSGKAMVVGTFGTEYMTARSDQCLVAKLLSTL